MKLVVGTKAAFKKQLLEAGVPRSQLEAALAHAEKKGPIKAGQTVSIPDRFTKEPSERARRATLGDVPEPGRRTSTGGKKMGALSIHAFDDVPRRSATRVDACGSSEIMIGAGFPGFDACGGTPVSTRPNRRAPALASCGDTAPLPTNVSACSGPSPSWDDACGGGSPVPTRSRRSAPTLVSCGDVVATRRRSTSGAC
ncbi:MAG: hypothetical protein HYV07_02475 [Deltaproteobacteria bacterium]|nr:hypothetical protein [Deltaproteobacteria bacterium]